MSTTTFDPAANGAPPLQSDQDIIAAMEAQRAALAVRETELMAELAKITPEVRRYEKAIKAIKGEPLGNPQGRTKTPGPKPAKKGKGISPAGIERAREAIRVVAADNDEFTQVQVRAITGEKSSSTSLAFEALRQEGFIRFARQQGLHKYFRLTHSAVAES